MGVSGVPMDKAKIIEAIHEKRGVIAHVAKKLNCHFSTIYNWMESDADVAKAVVDAREQKLRFYEDDDASLADKAREVLHRLLEENNATIAMFVAKTKGGFEGDGYGGKSITVNLIDK